MSDFVTSTARVSALSEQLLSLSQVERMLSAETPEDAFRVLNDLSWATAVPDVSGIDEFERVISMGLYELKSALMDAVPSRDLLRFLFLPFDLQNAKASLLAFVRQMEYDDIRDDLSSLSFYPRRTAYDILRGVRFSDEKGKFFIDALLRSKSVLDASSENVLLAETLLDAAFYQQMSIAVRALKNNLLLETFQKNIDAENIKKVIRSRSEKEVAFLDPMGSAEGYIFLSPDEAKKRLTFSSVNVFLHEAEKIVSENGDLSEWEVSMDLRILDSLFWPSRANPLQMENIVLFFWTKLRNAEVIRSILVRKRNRFSNEQVRRSVSVFFPYLPVK